MVKVFDQTHQLILTTAKELFLQNGYQNTSTRDIAKAAGLTQPALYYHFSNKEKLFLEINQQIGETLKTDFIQIAEGTGTIEEKLVASTKALLGVYHRDVFTFIHQSAVAMAGENRQQLFMILSTYYLEPLTAIFVSCDCEFNAKLDGAGAAQFYLMSLGLLFSQFHRLTTNEERDKQIAELMSVVLHGVVQ